jgi:hypothetical protein
MPALVASLLTQAYTVAGWHRMLYFEREDVVRNSCAAVCRRSPAADLP